MARVNKSQFAILGCLAINPMSAYEIKSFIKRSISHFWSESEGQLYPTLRKLSDEGMVVSKEETSLKSKIKIVYSITESGKETLKEWMTGEVDSPPFRNEMLLKVFFGSEVKEEITIKQINHSLESINKRLNMLEEITTSLAEKNISDQRKKYILLSLEYGSCLLNAEKEWCEHAIRRIEQP